MLHNSENTAKHHTNVALLKKLIRKGKTSLKSIFLLYSSSRITSFCPDISILREHLNKELKHLYFSSSFAAGSAGFTVCQQRPVTG